MINDKDISPFLLIMFLSTIRHGQYCSMSLILDARRQTTAVNTAFAISICHRTNALLNTRAVSPKSQVRCHFSLAGMNVNCKLLKGIMTGSVLGIISKGMMQCSVSVNHDITWLVWMRKREENESSNQEMKAQIKMRTKISSHKIRTKF